MSCPEIYDGGEDLTGLLSSFEVTYSMYSDFSASAQLQNPLCALGVDVINGSCIPMYANLTFEASGLTDVIDPEALEECYDPQVKWIAGLLTGFGETQDGTSDVVDVSIQSYHSRLNSKPIDSYLFSSDSENALSQIINYFAGIPAPLYYYDVTANPIYGTIDGGSTMDAIKLVAQLSYSTAYVQVGGELHITKWKDHNSPVELTIPNQLIGSVSKRADNLIPRLAVQVKGASISTDWCGERVVSDARTSDDEGGISNNPGPSNYTAISGIDTKSVKAVMANVQANKEDLTEAKVTSGLQFFLIKEGQEDGNLNLQINVDPDDPLVAIGKDGVEDKVMVSAAWRQSRRARIENNRALRELRLANAKTRRQQLAMQKRLAKLHAKSGDFFPSQVMGGPAGGPGLKSTGNGDTDSNTSTNNQLDVYAFNSTVGTACGASIETIENSLCRSRDVLFVIGVRRHQEMLMDNNSYNIDLRAAIPCLRLNQVISFETPGTADCPPVFKKALITEIKLGYDAEKQTTMSIVAADLDVLGQTTYSSTNLLDWQCGGGANALADNPWEASVLSLTSNATIQDNMITMFAKPPNVLTYSYLNQFCHVGEQYTLSFQYAKVFGGLVPSSALVHNNSSGIGATLTGPIGTFTETFTAATPIVQFQWMLVSVSGPVMWRIFDISLTRTVVA